MLRASLKLSSQRLFSNEENLFHGLSPKQFVDELEKQVNVKAILNNSLKSTRKIENSGYLSPTNRVDSGLSHISTATDRVKLELKQSPIKLKGQGFEETPYCKMVTQENQKVVPPKTLDYMAGVYRNQKFLELTTLKKQREQGLYQ